MTHSNLESEQCNSVTVLVCQPNPGYGLHFRSLGSGPVLSGPNLDLVNLLVIRRQSVQFPGPYLIRCWQLSGIELIGLYY